MTASDPLAPLRARFIQRAIVDGEALNEALEANAMDRVEPLVHGLAGSAGVFGFTEVSSAAIAIDTVFGRGETPPADQVHDLIALIRRTYS
ncbi:MAG: Hpt domain-containing protein [Caulobacteraceae bacterium]|nr:MAG: Hpt domain-containing protein [Caulobacteraceae bacterium]